MDDNAVYRPEPRLRGPYFRFANWTALASTSQKPTYQDVPRFDPTEFSKRTYSITGWNPFRPVNH